VENKDVDEVVRTCGRRESLQCCYVLHSQKHTFHQNHDHMENKLDCACMNFVGIDFVPNKNV